MLKVNFATGIIEENTNVPISVVTNTNDRMRVSDNKIEFIRAGKLYVANAYIVLTGVGGTSVTAQIYRNGTPVQGASSTQTISATTDIVTLPLQDAFRVFRSQFGDVADISVRLTEEADVIGGNAIVTYED